MAFEWTDELKAQVVELYEKAKPTPDNSMEVVAEIAEDLGATANGVRMILTKAGVYVKKTQTTSTAKSAEKEGGTKRVNKADSISELTNLIESMGAPVDNEILSKLTGKAAQYFTSVLTSAKSGE